MSTTPTADVEPGTRRVREQARDAATLMLFSLLLSMSLATCFLLLGRLGR